MTEQGHRELARLVIGDPSRFHSEAEYLNEVEKLVATNMRWGITGKEIAEMAKRQMSVPR